MTQYIWTFTQAKEYNINIEIAYGGTWYLRLRSLLLGQPSLGVTWTKPSNQIPFHVVIYGTREKNTMGF